MTFSTNHASIVISRLPFFTGVLEVPEEELPTYLPFTLAFNEEFGLVYQVPADEVDYWNEQAYRRGSSLSTPLGEGSFGDKQAQAAIGVIREIIDVRGLRVLEIGCGKGYLLKLLAEQGASYCVGFEPDPRAPTALDGGNIRIIHDFFNENSLDEKFDLILSHGVLEHVKDPIAFLKAEASALSAGGVVINGVPDCEESLDLGDPSVLAHEHYSYFTRSSLSRCYWEAGLSCESTTSSYGWMLYGVGRSVTSSLSLSDADIEGARFARFVQHYKRNTERLIELASKIPPSLIWGAQPNIVGLLDSRGLPYIVADGDVAKQGKYLPISTEPIQSPTTALSREPASVVVAPIHYDTEIRTDLAKNGYNGRIISCRSLFSENIAH